MRVLLLTSIIALALAGCATPEQLAAQDDAKCRSYGGVPGDASYVQCRAQLDAARTQAAAIDMARASAAANAPPMYHPPATQNCIRSSIGPIC